MDKSRVAAGLAVLSLLISVLALVVSWRAAVRPADEAAIAQAEKRVYQRILNETWQELKPAYQDFEIKTEPAPASFGEMMHPLLSVKTGPLTSPASVR